MPGLMIWCTCAENNKELYLRRVAGWYSQVKSIFGRFNPDYYVFVDGTITEDDLIRTDMSLLDLKFVNQTPKLGRSSVSVFQGWKRSLKTALEYGRAYKYIIHIENDVKILHTEKILAYMKEPGSYLGVCTKYGFPETAFMILNDQEANAKIIQHYADEKNLYETEIAENVIGALIRDTAHYVFHTDRMEDPGRFNPNYDYVCQYPTFLK